MSEFVRLLYAAKVRILGIQIPEPLNLDKIAFGYQMGSMT
jgi:hypothetical protein